MIRSTGAGLVPLRDAVSASPPVESLWEHGRLATLCRLRRRVCPQSQSTTSLVESLWVSGGGCGCGCGNEEIPSRTMAVWSRANAREWTLQPGAHPHDRRSAPLCWSCKTAAIVDYCRRYCLWWVKTLSVAMSRVALSSWWRRRLQTGNGGRPTTRLAGRPHPTLAVSGLQTAYRPCVEGAITCWATEMGWKLP
ncbi:hypothetical protein BS50DRAFT_152471 [Corynespora cassiicola Philippines]|uniref:Uncharacterized protein n=1 Tax=Corynespora cassiicola Philippines TaxID=1448308 RepID=A0A2T2N8W6_CORCC|nr:hypothetical protein BS50DRAFT_152471 [Corynespora cassiicola Philippines]